MAGRKTKLLAIGEVMAEIRTNENGSFILGFGGDTYNTAVYAAREIARAGVVAYLTRVGKEPLSATLLNWAAAEGIDTSYIVLDPDRNIGIYSISTNAQGERSFHYWRANSAARQLFMTEETGMLMPESEIIYLSGITLAVLTPTAQQRLIDTLAARRAAGTKIAFDSNYRPKLWKNAETARAIMQAVWRVTDIALPSICDEMELYGDYDEAAVVNRFAERSWDGIAIKRGMRGPVSTSIEPTAHPEFPLATSVIDTTAAGDSFNGGYLAAFLSGADEPTRLAAGHAVAARVVSAPGAIIPPGTV